MYVIDSTTRAKIYDGGLYYTPIVKIGDITIPNSQIKSISINDPIIDTTENQMYIGTFIAKKLDIEFRTLLNIDLSEQITYSIEINDNGVITEVPIGVFNVETSPTDYYKTYKISALDNSVKFKKNFNLNEYYTEDPTTGERTITASYMLNALCSLAGVELNQLSPDLVNTDAITGYEDTSISGKQYISYIAEIMGGNAKIERDGTLSIIPVKTPSVTTINGLASKSFTLDELYRVTKVRYDNGIVIPSESTAQIDDGNTLSIRPDNIFVGGDDLERQELINNIGNKVLGLQIQSLTTENYADFTLDSWDIVTYTLGENSYTTYYNNSFEFKGSIMGKVSVTIPTKNQEETTNVVGNEGNIINGIRTQIDNINGSLQVTAARTTENEDGIRKLNESVFYQDGETVRFALKEQLTNGDVTNVNAEGFTFTNEGLNISRKDEQGNHTTRTSSRLNEKGLEVIDNFPNGNKYYSHTANVSDSGSASSGYSSSLDYVDVVTIPTAVRLYVKVYYSTDSPNNDWLCIWAGSHSSYDPSDSNDYELSSFAGTDGRFMDGSETLNQNECTLIEGYIDGNSVTFGFHSDLSNGYYGYYATVYDAKDGAVLYAGYDEQSGETIVDTRNLTVHNYLKLDTVSRFENYTYTDGTNRAGIDNTKRTGLFWTNE